MEVINFLRERIQDDFKLFIMIMCLLVTVGGMIVHSQFVIYCAFITCVGAWLLLRKDEGKREEKVDDSKKLDSSWSIFWKSLFGLKTKEKCTRCKKISACSYFTEHWGEGQGCSYPLCSKCYHMGMPNGKIDSVSKRRIKEVFNENRKHIKDHKFIDALNKIEGELK